MHENLPDTQPGLAWMLTAIFSIWGGMAQYLNALAKSKRKFTWVGLIGSGFVSGFSGLMLGFLAYYYQANLWLMLFGAGLGGGMGMKTVDIVQWLVKQKFGYKEESTEEPPK